MLAFAINGKNAVDREAARLIRKAVKEGFPADYSNNLGVTLLHIAPIHNSLEACHALIESGVNVNLQNMWGETPFFNACYHNKINCAKLLIDAGASRRQIRFGIGAL